MFFNKKICVVTEKKRKEVGGGANPYGNRKQEQKHTETARLFPNVSETRSRNTEENPIAALDLSTRKRGQI